MLQDQEMCDPWVYFRRKKLLLHIFDDTPFQIKYTTEWLKRSESSLGAFLKILISMDAKKT